MLVKILEFFVIQGFRHPWNYEGLIALKDDLLSSYQIITNGSLGPSTWEHLILLNYRTKVYSFATYFHWDFFLLFITISQCSSSFPDMRKPQYLTAK